MMINLAINITCIEKHKIIAIIEIKSKDLINISLSKIKVDYIVSSSSLSMSG